MSLDSLTHELDYAHRRRIQVTRDGYRVKYMLALTIPRKTLFGSVVVQQEGDHRQLCRSARWSGIAEIVTPTTGDELKPINSCNGRQKTRSANAAGIRKPGGHRKGGVDMAAHHCIANRIAPVDQALLHIRLLACEVSSDCRESERLREGTGKGIWAREIGNVAVDSPVAAGACVG